VPAAGLRRATPVICAQLGRRAPSPDGTWLARLVERVLGLLVRSYARSLGAVLNHRAPTLFVMPGIIAVTAMLYVQTPKGFFPSDDTGLISGGTPASGGDLFQAEYLCHQ